MNSRLYFFVLTNIYIFCLIYLYCEFVYPKYSYLGLQLNDNVDSLLILFIGMATSFFVFFIKRRIDGPLEILIIITYLVIYLPALNLALICLNQNNNLFSLYSSYTLAMIILIFISKVNVKKINLKSLTGKQFKIIFYGIVALLFSVVFLAYKPDLSNIYKLADFKDVYDIRGDYREANNNIPSFIKYFFTWLVKFFIPIFFVFAIVRKSVAQWVLSFAMLFSMFMVSGHKSIILGFGLIGLMYLVVSSKKNDSLQILKYLSYLVISSLGLALINLNVLQEIIVRRAILMPGILSNMFFNYFNENGFAYMGYSFMSFIVDYKYSATPPYVIGEYYFGRPDMSANANYMASAYADFGVLGVVFITLICGIYFKIINIIVEYKQIKKISCMMAIVPMWALLDSSFITVMFTHGLFLLLIFIILIPKGFINDK